MVRMRASCLVEATVTRLSAPHVSYSWGMSLETNPRGCDSPSSSCPCQVNTLHLQLYVVMGKSNLWPFKESFMGFPGSPGNGTPIVAPCF